MQINQKKISLLKKIIFVVSPIVLGLIVAAFLLQNNNTNVVDLGNVPPNDVPLLELDNSPKSYSITCTIREIVVSKVEIKHVSGKVFALCDYATGTRVDQLAVLLGYDEESNKTTYMFGKQFGLFNGLFEMNAFENLATQAGFVPGAKLGVAMTPIGFPKEGEGISRHERLGGDIDKIYEDKESFNVFAKTGISSNLPKIGKVKGVPIVFPVFVVVIP